MAGSIETKAISASNLKLKFTEAELDKKIAGRFIHQGNLKTRQQLNAVIKAITRHHLECGC